MSIELDWSAPILPGVSMMGLSLGLSYQEVWNVLQSYKVKRIPAGNNIIIQFKNSPELVLDREEGGIILRHPLSRSFYSQNLEEMFVIGFKNDVLIHLMTSLVYGESLEYYKGRIFGEVGLETPLSALEKYCRIEFDSGDELFYPEDQNYRGFSIGGSCSSLEEDPEQTVSYIRVYRP